MSRSAIGRETFGRSLGLISFLIGALIVPTYFCNIPVFRFALERWQPDAFEMIILTKGENDEAGKTALKRLNDYGRQNPGCCRMNLQSLDSDSSLNADIEKLASSLGEDTTFPYLFVRTKIGRGRLATPWQGQLSDFRPSKFFASPARKELASRLLKGQSVVWLVVNAKDDETNNKLTSRLRKQLASLEKKISLPEGIGLPGSELYSSIPLSMKFSVLNINHDDKQESSLVDFLKQFQPDAFEEDIPLIVPVFGKGRALEVVTADRLDDGLIEDLSIFLSGACSCQVKDLNPGFDLPMVVKWNEEIFGEDVELPPAEGPGQQRSKQPELVPIAPGNKSKQGGG